MKEIQRKLVTEFLIASEVVGEVWEVTKSSGEKLDGEKDYEYLLFHKGRQIASYPGYNGEQFAQEIAGIHLKEQVEINTISLIAER